MTIDPTVYRRAVERLSEGLARHKTDPADAEVRDGVIQRFEYTYDLAAKMLRRALADNEDSPGEADRLTFAAMIRTAWEKGLTSVSYATWQEFRNDRNKTSHTYLEAIAIEVMEKVPAFLAEARFVLERLEAQGAER